MLADIQTIILAPSHTPFKPVLWRWFAFVGGQEYWYWEDITEKDYLEDLNPNSCWIVIEQGQA